MGSGRGTGTRNAMDSGVDNILCDLFKRSVSVPAHISVNVLRYATIVGLQYIQMSSYVYFNRVNTYYISSLQC